MDGLAGAENLEKDHDLAFTVACTGLKTRQWHQMSSRRLWEVNCTCKKYRRSQGAHLAHASRLPF